MGIMNYLRLVPYAIMIILLSVIGYQQFTFNKSMKNIQSELIISQNNFNNYKLEQKDNQIKIITAITESNNKKVGELNEAINKINNSTNDNRIIINQLRETTTNAETNYDRLSEASRKRYITTINQLFNESAELLIESSNAADRSTEAAITYHNMLDDQYNIVNEINNKSDVQ